MKLGAGEATVCRSLIYCWLGLGTLEHGIKARELLARRLELKGPGPMYTWGWEQRLRLGAPTV